MRELCSQCLRPQKACWCTHVRQCQLTFDLTLLMHPREHRVGIGTARMVHRSCHGSHLLVRDCLTEADARSLGLLHPDVLPAVLFPSPQAIDLEGDVDGLSQALQGKRLHVVVLDGTWPQAKQLLTRSPVLQSFTHLAFRPTGRARYDAIRMEPTLESHSTLEAVVGLIDRLDAKRLCAAPPQQTHHAMLTLLEHLVSEQVAFVPPEHQARRALRLAREPNVLTDK